MLAIMILIVVCGVLWICDAILYHHRGCFKGFYHDKLGWHKPTSGCIGSDGFNFYSTCRYCHKNIMMDGQGNWFEGGSGFSDDSTTGNE